MFIDTNVLVYALDDGEPAKKQIARDCIERESVESVLVVSTQVLQELYHALTRGAHPIRTPEAAESAVRGAARLDTVNVDSALVFAAIARSQRDRLAFWDALIVESALAGGCARLLSEDLQAGRAFGTLVVSNPFATS